MAASAPLINSSLCLSRGIVKFSQLKPLLSTYCNEGKRGQLMQLRWQSLCWPQMENAVLQSKLSAGEAELPLTATRLL